jgi:hypothetical protein
MDKVSLTQVLLSVFACQNYSINFSGLFMYRCHYIILAIDDIIKIALEM